MSETDTATRGRQQLSSPAATVASTSDVSLINFISQAVRDPTIDIGKLESLIRIQREIAAEHASAEFNRAMSAAQGEMRPVVRDASNEQTRSRYARLETIDDLIRPIYTRHGFSLTFNTERPEEPGNIRIVCKIAHSGGHCETYALEAAPDVMGAKGNTNKTALHGLGSTVSYLRRYLTCMIYNVVLTNDDDDGNAGGGKVQTRRDQPPRERQQQQEPDQPDQPLPPQDAAKTFLASVQDRLAACQSLDEVSEIEQHPTIVKALARPPSEHRDRLERMIAQRKADFRTPSSSAAEPEFEPQYLVDQFGVKAEQPYFDPERYAAAIVTGYGQMSITDGENFLCYNEDGIYKARKFPAAAARLASLEGGGEQEVQTLVAMDPIQPPVERGGTSWLGYVRLLRAALANVPDTQLLSWLEQQRPVLVTAPLVQRLGAITSIKKAIETARVEFPPWLVKAVEPGNTQ